MDDIQKQNYKKADSFLAKAQYQKRLQEEVKGYKLINRHFNHDYHLVMKSLIRLGDGFYDLKDYEKAIKCYLRIVDLYKQQPNTKKSISIKAIYLKLINSMAMIKDSDNMIFFSDKVIKKGFLSTNEKIALLNQLTVYLERDYYKSNIETYLLSILELELKKDPIDSFDHSDALLGLGAFYYEEERYHDAIYYLEQAVLVYHDLDEPREYLFDCYIMLIHIYKEIDNKVKYIHYFQIANKLDTKLTKMMIEF